MLDAMYIAAIGLQAQKDQLDAVASNLANAGTTAFKRQSVDFSAILDRAPASAALDAIENGATRPHRLVRLDLAPGETRTTGRPLDIAILGAGFVEVVLPGEQIGYSRAGSLQIADDGTLSLLSGHVLKADIRVPADARDLQILRDGSVTAVLGDDADATVLGQIELAMFADPEGLEYRGEGLFTAPEDAAPMLVRPGEQGAGELAARALEGSNVKMVDEMVSLMLMQRVYELNSRVVQVADELMSMSNNMRRSG